LSPPSHSQLRQPAAKTQADIFGHHKPTNLIEIDMSTPTDEERNAKRIAMLETQLAATIGVVSCLMEITPKERRLDLHKRLHRMLETTHAGLLGASDEHSEHRLEAMNAFRVVVFGDPKLSS
jgi:hypothetical protein